MAAILEIFKAFETLRSHGLDFNAVFKSVINVDEGISNAEKPKEILTGEIAKQLGFLDLLQKCGSVGPVELIEKEVAINSDKENCTMTQREAEI